jgi:hypothetical protein
VVERLAAQVAELVKVLKHLCELLGAREAKLGKGLGVDGLESRGLAGRLGELLNEGRRGDRLADRVDHGAVAMGLRVLEDFEHVAARVRARGIHVELAVGRDRQREHERAVLGGLGREEGLEVLHVEAGPEKGRELEPGPGDKGIDLRLLVKVLDPRELAARDGPGIGQCRPHDCRPGIVRIGGGGVRDDVSQEKDIEKIKS